MLTNVKESHDECVENVGETEPFNATLISSGEVVVAMVDKMGSDADAMR
jgi:hypothetical protein